MPVYGISLREPGGVTACNRMIAFTGLPAFCLR